MTEEMKTTVFRKGDCARITTDKANTHAGEGGLVIVTGPHPDGYPGFVALVGTEDSGSVIAVEHLELVARGVGK